MDTRKSEDSPAQTASVGDRAMMTYMKLPLPNVNSRNNAPSSNDSDDARFLDGLFDRLSGASDNGSDKDTKEGGSDSNNCSPGAQMSRVSLSMNSNTRNGNTLRTYDLSNSTHSSVNLHQNEPHRVNRSTGELSARTKSSHLQSIGNVSSLHTQQVQVPLQQQQQQMIFQQQTENNTAFAVNHQHPANTTIGSGIGMPLNTNPNLQTSPMQQIHPWSMNPAVSAVANNQIQNVNASSAAMNTINHHQAVVVNRHLNPPVSVAQPHQSIHAFQVPVEARSHTQISQLPLPTQDEAAAAPFYVEEVLSAAVSVSSSSAAPTLKSIKLASSSRGRKRPKSVAAVATYSINSKSMTSSVSEDEGDVEKRRRERNVREQERSQRISTQISDLKSLLASSNVAFKPDKYSTLVSVFGYIKTLQQRSILLDEEQKKMVETITKSNDLVTKSQNGNQAVTSSSTSAYRDSSGRTGITGAQKSSEEEDEIVMFVRGLDYRNIFSRIKIALCVTSIDGRLLACNDEFVHTCGLARETLVSSGIRKPQEGNETEEVQAGKSPLSLFNLMAREEMQLVFDAMSRMLKSPHQNESNRSQIHSSTGGGEILQNHSQYLKSDHWHCIISQCHNSSTKLQLNISLVRQEGRTPTFFNCALTSLG
uniref:BHLH domain-containing protein n=1 Tax=Chaetoceros debilis TaxID=122233 RepID=A0A7S3V6C6_9STRA